MRKALFLLFLLLLPFQAVALDGNSLDFNGPITLELTFEQQVIGGEDYNASGWIFSKNEDFYFKVDAPSLEKLYFLDFVDKDVKVFEENSVPSYWHPMLSTNESFSFRLNDVLGGGNLTVFLLQKNDSGVTYNYLTPGQQVAVVVDSPTDFFLLIDADSYGQGNFSFSTENHGIGVTVDFRAMPSAWEYVEKFGMTCTENSGHRCLVMPDGSQFDFDACVDPNSEQNASIGQGAPPEVCIEGEAAYRNWREEALQSALDAAKGQLDIANNEKDPETAKRVGDLSTEVSRLSGAFSLFTQSNASDTTELLAAVSLVIIAVIVSWLYRKKRLPFGRISFEKTTEGDLNGIPKRENAEPKRFF